MSKLHALLLSFAVLGFASSATAVSEVVLTFDEDIFQHGTIVSTQYQAQGVTIMATNVGSGPGLAVAFDSNLGPGASADDDLQFVGEQELVWKKRRRGRHHHRWWRGRFHHESQEFGHSHGGSSELVEGWAGGNIADEPLGNLLIIQENNIGCGDGVCDVPDDEGSRPAGTLVFQFDMPVLSFGFDLIDIEDVCKENGSITFYDGFESLKIEMREFLAGYELGDRTANRIDPFLVADLMGIDEIDRVDITLGGSGAVDNVRFEPVPEPGTAALMSLGLASLAISGRRRRQIA